MRALEIIKDSRHKQFGQNIPKTFLWSFLRASDAASCRDRYTPALRNGVNLEFIASTGDLHSFPSPLERLGA